MHNEMTRREFGQWVGGALVGLGLGGAAQAQETITAAQAVERIKKKLAGEGVSWRPSRVDGFKMGDPNITVTGVATCFQPTFDVVRRAAAKKLNFVVSHEAALWMVWDPNGVIEDDSVAQAKARFIAENKMALWRIHDHWHARRPDPIFTAIAQKLGWLSYYNTTARPRHFAIPEASLEEVARHIQERLGTKNVMVVGDPKLRVKKIGDQSHTLAAVAPALRACDAVMIGETAQHDTFEYVRDAMAIGMKTAAIMIAHEALEEWGMEAFVDWFKPSIPGIPIEWVSSGDPFKIPAVKVA
jgi:putative NIF3 family GTP cyclohydrolase 1 type 2